MTIFFKKITLIILCFCATYLSGQDAIDYYNSAKAALERGDTEIGLRHLNNCQNILGGSNAKIESLRFQAFYQKGRFLDAAKAFKNYDDLLPNELKNSVAYNELKTLNEEVWKQLNAEKKAEEERLKNEIERDLTTLKNKNINYENESKSAYSKFLEKNANELAKVALEKNDSVMLAFYKTQFSDKGKTNKSVELELDKKVNPIKYKRLDEIEKMTATVYRYYNYGNKSYENYDYHNKADSLISYLFNNYKPSEFEASNMSKLKALKIEVKERYKWNKEYYDKLRRIREYDNFQTKIENMQGKFFDTDGIGRGIAGGGLAGVGMGGLFYLIDGSDALSKTFLVIGGVGVAIGGIIMLSEYISYQSYLKRMRKAKAKLERMKADIGPVLEKRNEKLNGLPLINI
jgi:hypothetical protein